MKGKIGKDGRITLPKALRERCGLLPGTEVRFEPEPLGIRIRKQTKDPGPIRQVYGVLGTGGRTDAYLDAIRGK